MQIQVAWILALASALACQGVLGKPSKVIVAFGDSLTDNGNLFRSDGSEIPNPKVYWRGRFTNSPGTWADQLAAADRRLQVVNFAYGGANACKYTELPSPLSLIPTLDEQIQLFNKKGDTDKAFNATLKGKMIIPAIWIGHNDIQDLPLLPNSVVPTVPARTVECIINATAALLLAGHKTVVVGNLAPIDLSPVAFSSNLTAQLKFLVSSINAGIQAGVTGLNVKFPNQAVLLWDTNAELTNAVQNWKKLGFKHDNTQSCIDGGPGYSAMQGSMPRGICKHPNDYIFYDHEHGTAKAHKIMAKGLVDLFLAAKVLKPVHRTGRR